MTTLRLPLPPSANRYWRTARNRVYVSEEAQAYKAEAGWLAQAAGVEMLEGEVKLSVDVYMITHRADLSNRIKVLEDALNGIAWIDDQQISELHARRYRVPKAKRGERREGFVLVTIERMTE